MDSDADQVAIQFQERRAQTGRRLRPWFAMAAVGFGSVALVFFTPFPSSEYWRFWLLFGGFLAGAMSFVAINLVIQARYRCPACGGTVSDDRGVLLNPDTCPRCGARLRP